MFKYLLCFALLLTAGARAEEQTDLRNLSLTGVNLSARVLLLGAYDRNTGLMGAGLMSSGWLPVAQPYTEAPYSYAGSESLSATVQALGAQDAVVDWVLLELRSATDATTVVARKAVVLQRDGDLVDAATGQVAINFASVPAGSYYVALYHRNHLGVMTLDTVPLATSVYYLDFSNPALLVSGLNARMVDNSGFALLWAGDSNQDQRLIAFGVGNDANPLLAEVLTAAENSGFNTSYRLDGYRIGDFNLDGKAVFSGPGNDVNYLIANILLAPQNSSLQSNFIFHGGLEP